MSLLTNTTTRCSLILLISALVVSGCSSSGDSSSDGAQLPAGVNTDVDNVTLAEGTDAVANTMEAATIGDTTTSNTTPDDTTTSDTSTTVDVPVSATVASTMESEIALATESVDASTTRVDFEITVPAYSSNELQVRVLWGDIQEAAGWVGDEYWTLSKEFPSNTEHTLLVTFFDRNGDVTLASYESTFRTGSNSAEGYQIFAEQFDSDQWDTDGDGLSNLDESIVGGDSVQLELRDAYFVRSKDLGTSTYESQLPDERPYYEHVDIVPDVESRPDYIDPRLGLTQTLTIDVDESGTGTFEDYQYYYFSPGDYTVSTYSANRTNTDDSVIWNGESNRASQGEVRNFYKSSVEVKRVNAQALSADGAYSSRWNGHDPAYLHVYEYTLVGEPVSDSTACEPLSGTLTHEYITGGRWTLNSASKGTDDQFWTVVETAVEVDGYPDEASDYPVDIAEIVDTYLTRTLGMTFYCDYPELR